MENENKEETFTLEQLATFGFKIMREENIIIFKFNPEINFITTIKNVKDNINSVMNLEAETLNRYKEKKNIQ